MKRSKIFLIITVCSFITSVSFFMIYDFEVSELDNPKLSEIQIINIYDSNLEINLETISKETGLSVEELRNLLEIDSANISMMNTTANNVKSNYASIMNYTMQNNLGTAKILSNSTNPDLTSKFFIQLGNEYLRNKEYKSAITAYDIALSFSNNTNINALLGKADVLVTLERFEEAIVEYDKALSLTNSSDNVGAYNGIGFAYLNMGFYHDLPLNSTDYFKFYNHTALLELGPEGISEHCKLYLPSHIPVWCNKFTKYEYSKLYVNNESQLTSNSSKISTQSMITDLTHNGGMNNTHGQSFAFSEELIGEEIDGFRNPANIENNQELTSQEDNYIYIILGVVSSAITIVMFALFILGKLAERKSQKTTLE